MLSSKAATLYTVVFLVILPSDWRMCDTLLLPEQSNDANMLPVCMHYDYKCDKESLNSSSSTRTTRCSSELRTCDPLEYPGKRPQCFVAWRNVSGVIELHLQGCWIYTDICYNKKECIGWAVDDSSSLFYCCCDADACNTDFTWSGEIMDRSSLATTVTARTPSTSSQLPRVLLLSLGPLLIITVVVIIGFLLWRCCHMPPLEMPHDTPLLTPPSPVIGCMSMPVQLLELQAHGRFGSVYRATIVPTGETVAVKVFPTADRQSWLTERAFYSQPFIGSHECILRCFGAEQHDTELWLITEFHEHGSLFDYLKGNVVSWPQLVSIATSLADGVAFLHSYRGSWKPPVAHCDLKSRNVLLKTGLKTCIADFGLATILDDKMTGMHAQVGTRRYMAPEVLDGSIGFSIDFILKIDIYAFALILWELVSRCTAGDGVVREYRMPFEDEVGQSPTLEEMQSLVVSKKVRPCLPASANHQGLVTLCMTIDECWDNDPEARLSAECIYERMLRLDGDQQPSAADVMADEHGSLFAPSSDLTDCSSDKASRSTESSTCAV
jgi:serine/threonine protein kinase